MAQLETPLTEAEFEKHTGRKPENDDMERVNCQVCGTPGHNFCGWNHRVNKPYYENSQE